MNAGEATNQDAAANNDTTSLGAAAPRSADHH